MPVHRADGENQLELSGFVIALLVDPAAGVSERGQIVPPGRKLDPEQLEILGGDGGQPRLQASTPSPVWVEM